VPVYARGQFIGTLRLGRRLPEEREYFESILWTQLGTTLALVGLCALIALIVGYLIIGKPIAALQDQARRVAKGDLTSNNKLIQKDEIGRLAVELNRMSGKLAKSRSAAAAEKPFDLQALTERALALLRESG
jgi:nitrate/nitrite-specific signal transduction histidine kinase